jgi:hypothetical protein
MPTFFTAPGSVHISRFFLNTKDDIPGFPEGMEFELAEEVEDLLRRGYSRPGYRDGVVLVDLPPRWIRKGIRSRVVRVTPDTEFVTFCKSRVPGETPRKKTMALVDELPLADYLTVVLYRWDVLAEDNDRSTDAEWEVVTLLAQVDQDEPMAPATLMANHFKADGGTATNMSPVEFEAALRKSYDYWKGRSLGITKQELA